MALKDRDRVSNLCTAMQSSRLAMRRYRQERLEVVRLLAGSHYSENGARKKRYVDLLGLYQSIITRQLISKEPRVMLTTHDEEGETSVRAMEEFNNQELPRMQFAWTMEQIVNDALISMGVSMIGVCTPEYAAMSGYVMQAGDPCIWRIDPEDFCPDMTANDFRECDYLAHRFRADLEVVESNPKFNKKARENLQPSVNPKFNQEGDERIGNIGRSNYELPGEYRPKVDLWQVYCPKEKCIRILSDDDMAGPSGHSSGDKTIPLYEDEYVGHEFGPYRVLSLGIPVSGNLLPRGPIMSVVDLDDLANEIYRKLARQASRCKDVTYGRKDNTEDNERARTANDGDFVPVMDPNAIKFVGHPGPNQGLLLFLGEVIKRFSWQAGNLDSMGGLAVQAGTATQEELLHSQSNGQIAAMQQSVARFVGSNIEALNWLWWYHPKKIATSRYSTEAMPELWQPRKVYPGHITHDYNHRSGRMEEVLSRKGPMPQVKIDAYSLRHQTPQQKMQDIIGIVTKIYLPMAQLAQQQGDGLDVGEFFRMIGRMSDIPELKRIIKSVAIPPAEPQQAQGGMGVGGPQETSHETIRSDVGQNSSRENDANMEAMLELGASRNGQMNGAA